MITLTLLSLASSLVGWLMYLKCRQRLARCRIVAARFSTENKELMREHTRLYQDCVALRRELSALKEAPLSAWERRHFVADEPSRTVAAFETIVNQPVRRFGAGEPQED